jgi:hypothetical protein
MTRRLALAISSALTIIVTFGVVSIGAQTGLFGGDHKATTKQAAAAGAGDQASAANAAPHADPSGAPQDPLVVTDYVYIDQTPMPIYVVAPRSAQASGSAPSAAPTSAAKPSNVAPEPNGTPAAAKTAAAATSPTAPAASATATSPAAPTATAAQPTQAPAQPTATAIPTQPPSQPAEIEFVGTVTAINGSIVTFSHRGTPTQVKVTSGLSQLGIGTIAQVHARLQDGVYVATEIETGD